MKSHTHVALMDTHCALLHRFINKLHVSSLTYAHIERQRVKRQCCAAAEWEQKRNGGSYIRE